MKTANADDEPNRENRLKKMYIDGRMPIQKIAQKSKVEYSLIESWLRAYKIPIRYNNKTA